MTSEVDPFGTIDACIDSLSRVMEIVRVFPHERVEWRQALDDFPFDVVREAFIRAGKTMHHMPTPEGVADIARAVLEGLPIGYAVTKDGLLMRMYGRKMESWLKVMMGGMR